MLLASVVLSILLVALEEALQSTPQAASRPRVFLDCGDDGCYDDYLRETVKVVEYVRDRTDADVHVLVTRAATASRGIEFTMAFIGQGRFDGTSQTLRVITESAETEDGTRQRLASALPLGVLGFIASEAVPADLRVVAEVAASSAAPRPASTDPWRRWIFSVNGSGELEAEESTEETEWGLTFGADRITPQWKISFGSEFNQSDQDFELDDGERLSATTRTRSVNGLVGRSAGEHWSFGGRGQVRSSTFDNTSWTWRSRRQLLPGFVDQSPERRRRGQRPHRERALFHVRSVGIAYSRSAVIAAPRCDRGRSAPASAATEQRIRDRRTLRSHLSIRVALREHRQSSVRPVGRPPCYSAT
jgi:hypothetical protein